MYSMRGESLPGSTRPSKRAPGHGTFEVLESREAHKLDFRERAEVFTAISGRNSSWIEDEAICLAIVLDLELGKLYQTMPSKRMEVLVRMWDSVPRALPFVPGPGMEQQGLKWMPRSLLNSRERFSVRDDGKRLPQPNAKRMENGLVLQGMPLS